MRLTVSALLLGGLLLAGPSSSVAISLSPPELPDRGVWQFHVTRDGGRVVYEANHGIAGRRELYSVPIGGGPVVTLSGSLGTGVGSVRMTPDDGVLYITDQDTAGVRELYRVPVQGGRGDEAERAADGGRPRPGRRSHAGRRPRRVPDGPEPRRWDGR